MSALCSVPGEQRLVAGAIAMLDGTGEAGAAQADPETAGKSW